MAKTVAPVSLAFNRGIVSDLALARIDIERIRSAAETMTNWMPRVLGPMMLRPGQKHLGSTASNAFARCIEFVFGVDDYARLELTDNLLRVWVEDALVTRETVSASVTNGNFTSDVASWTDADESGATSQWLTGGYLALLGDGTNSAIRQQEVTVTETGTEHALRIVVERGPIRFRIGSSAGGEDFLAETSLGTGEHSLAFTPTGNFHIQVSSQRSYTVLVDSINVEAAGVMTLPTPWDTDDIENVRHSQSGDVVYLADGANQQRKIERRSVTSWSLVLYEPETGPFRTINTSNVTIATDALDGDVTLTASKSIFKTNHVGALFRVASIGQTVNTAVSAENTFSDPIRVTGVGQGRRFSILISGTFTATVTVQYSIGAPGTWVDLATTYTAPTSTSHLDNQDNQIIYYRIGVKTGEFTDGTANVTLSFSAGSISGVARITEYTSGTEVEAVVLKAFGAGTASSDWWEGQWSDYRGWPSAVSLFEGRNWQAGKDVLNGSIADAYEDFDDEFEGDAGPISRSIGEGPIDTIHWLLSLGRLLVGTAINSARIAAKKIDGNNILAARSSSFDEPLTPSNFALKNTSARGVFVDRSLQRLYELKYSIQTNDYEPEDLSLVCPDLNEIGIVGIAVQMKPDVRVHCWRTDGTVAILIFDRAENVIAWVEYETDGEVEDVTVLPGTVEDAVYYIVKRTIDGNTVRYHERWALESECQGGAVNKQADSFVEYSGAATTTITDLGHLEGETVVAWGGGKDLGTYVVNGGSISGLPEAVTAAIVGLSYQGLYKSVKPAFGEDYGVPLNQRGQIDQIGFILKNTHYQALEFGPDFTTMDNLPLVEDGVETDEDEIWSHYDKDMIPFPGNYSTDPRVCLRATAPRPVTVLSCIARIDRSNK